MRALATCISNQNSPFNHIPGLLLWIKNTESIYLDGNDNCAKLFGQYSCKDINGKTDYDIQHKFSELAALFQANDQDVIQSNKVKRYIEILEVKKSDWKIFFVTKSPLFNQENLIGTFGHSMDVTQSFIKMVDFLTTGNINCIHHFKTQHSFIIGREYKNITFTPRQAECLFFLLRGKSIKLISQVLLLSVRTIEDHIDQIKMKFNCKHKNDLIETAIQQGYFNLLPESIFNKQFSLLDEF